MSLSKLKEIISEDLDIMEEDDAASQDVLTDFHIEWKRAGEKEAYRWVLELINKFEENA